MGIPLPAVGSKQREEALALGELIDLVARETKRGPIGHGQSLVRSERMNP